MNVWQNKIYNLLPLFFQNIAISAYGYHWSNRRFGGVFERELNEFKAREEFSNQKWLEFQTLQLRKMLIHAFENVPFYRNSYMEAGFNLSQLSALEIEDLQKLPFLNKDSLRKWGATQLIAQKRESKGHFFNSSGSTGTPTQILFSYPMHQRWSAAYEARVRNWAGVTRFDARGMIGGRRVVPDGLSSGPFYRYNFAEKQAYFSAYHISKNTSFDYLNGIRKYKLKYMVGYAMSNYFLARFFKELNFKPPQMKAVLTSSEKLTLEMRRTFQEVYGCKTFDAWSGVEACALVSECEHGNLHLSPDVGIVELITANGQYAKPGEIGEVICTGFLNFDQPLIRYKIGDLMRLGSRKCKCGRDMPVIDEIIGRLEDTVIGLDGREIVRFHGIFVQLPKVLEGQIIQHELDRFEIKINSDGPLSVEDRKTILSRMVSQLGPVTIDINQVNSISRGPNGKFKSVISHVKKPTYNS